MAEKVALKLKFDDGNKNTNTFTLLPDTTDEQVTGIMQGLDKLMVNMKSVKKIEETELKTV